MSTATAETGRPEPFSLFAVVLLVTVGLGGFAAFLMLLAWAPERADDRHGASALSRAGTGFAGIVELLRQQGVQVTVSRVAADRRAAAAPRAGLFVLTPPPDGRAIPTKFLDDRNGTVLVVLPKWRVKPLADHPGWVESHGLVPEGEIENVMPAPMVIGRQADPQVVLHGGSGRMNAIGDLAVGAVDPLQAVETSFAWTPVLLDAAAHPVLLRWTGHRVYVLADPDLFDTRGLASLDTARAAVAIVDDLRDNGPVTFDVALDGFGEPPGLLRLLFEPPLLGATLCGAAAGLLMLLMALHRFGPALRPERVHDLGKRALADNSAGLIALARREPRMAEPYAQLVRGLAAQDLGAPSRLDVAALDAVLDGAARHRGLADTWTGLAAAAAAVRSRADLMRVAARLHDWRTGMRHDHR